MDDFRRGSPADGSDAVIEYISLLVALRDGHILGIEPDIAFYALHL